MTILSVKLRIDKGKLLFGDIFYLQEPVFSLYFFVVGKSPEIKYLKYVIVTHSAQDHLSNKIANCKELRN